MDCQELFKARRAINFFDPYKPVTAKALKEMITLASLAPSSFNLQPWSLIIVTDHDEKAALRALAMDQHKVTEAPVVLIFLADRDGWKSEAPTLQKALNDMVKGGFVMESQRDGYIGNAVKLYGGGPEYSLAFACKNVGFFAMSMMYAAKCVGLETHPMDGFDHEGVRREFAIPDNFWVPLIMAVGYFKEGKTSAPPKWRKSFEEIVVKFK